MSWDPEILRKFSSTGHFRLLNQVRNELKSNPIIREHKFRALKQNQTPNKTKNDNANIEIKKNKESLIISNREQSAQTEPAKSTTKFSSWSVDPSDKTTNTTLSSEVNEGKKTFKERLSDIDMR